MKIIQGILPALLLFSFTWLNAQERLVINPAQPHPGDKVSFTYTLPDDLIKETKMKCVIRMFGPFQDEFPLSARMFSIEREDTLSVENGICKSVIRTNAENVLLAFEFATLDAKVDYSDGKMKLVKGKIDNNDNRGFLVPLYNSDGKTCRYSGYFSSNYLAKPIRNGLMISNPDLAIKYSRDELAKYPELRNPNVSMIAGLLQETDKEKARAFCQEQMDLLFGKGIETEEDYSLASSLSRMLGVRNLGKYFNRLAFDKFKDGTGMIALNETYNAWEKEKDTEKKMTLAYDFLKRFDQLPYMAKSSLASSTASAFIFKQVVLEELALSNNTGKFYQVANEWGFVKEKGIIEAGVLAELTEKFIEKENFKEAEKILNDLLPFLQSEYERRKLLGFKVETKNEVFFDPDGIKFLYLKNLFNTQNSISKIHEKQGKIAEAFGEAQKAQGYLKMMDDNFFKVPDFNLRYATMADKILPRDQAKREIEAFVTDGGWMPEMRDMLKKYYIAEHNSEQGFDDYFDNLKKDKTDAFIKELQRTRLNERAYAFSLTDLDGNTVSLESLKGKIVILDFWATWCGPCKASFPAMLALQEHYKNNPGVKILFVNTGERFKSKEENVAKVKEYLTSMKYPFHVVLDVDNKVAGGYKAAALPTKCMIDKEGRLCYRISGAETNPAKLIDEINAMIKSLN